MSDRPTATIEVRRADITTIDADAVVNAANGALMPGGGVAGAIHHAAGPGLQRECEQIPESEPGTRCPPGDAVITDAHDLPAKRIIHTVGPVWQGGDNDEPATLARCYENAIALADEHDLRSIAFPAISAGAFGYPLDDAARVAADATRRAARAHPAVERITFCVIDDETERAFRDALDR